MQSWLLTLDRSASRRTPAPGPAKHPHGPPPDRGLSVQVHGALQRAELGWSASVVDFLEESRTGDRQHPSLSKPPETTTSHHQTNQHSDPRGTAPFPRPRQPLPAGAGESHPRVTRRERPHISSTLAASVGLPCPSPPPHPITSPPTMNTVQGAGVTGETMATARKVESDGVNQFSLPLPSSLPRTQHRLSSLRISESSLLSPSQPSEIICGGQSEGDEVFFPPPSPLPIRASDVMAHSPPSPLEREVLGGT
ncbi:hypothetical protein CRUP_037857, partial [Coryphaenoides rupestris]